MKFNTAIASATFFALTTVGLLTYTTVLAQANTNTFRVADIRYDESTGNKLPLPTIPKSWKLVGISNGEKINANSLWFQASDGNIYLLTGFHDGRTFIIDGSAQKLNVR